MIGSEEDPLSTYIENWRESIHRFFMLGKVQ